MRTASIAALRAMVSNQPVTEPRRGSNPAANRHARAKVSCATSSATAGTPTTASASPKTRAW